MLPQSNFWAHGSILLGLVQRTLNLSWTWFIKILLTLVRRKTNWEPFCWHRRCFEFHFLIGENWFPLKHFHHVMEEDKNIQSSILMSGAHQWSYPKRNMCVRRRSISFESYGIKPFWLWEVFRIMIGRTHTPI